MDIIIVEDDELTVIALKAQLHNMGHHVVAIADSFAGAIKIPAKINVDLALLDINIVGKKSGVDIAKVFQSTYNLPCIFLTSTSNDFIINQVREIGVYGYILKPISNKDLFTAIEIAEIRFKNDQLKAQKNQELEKLVASRTLALKEANDQLEEEIQYTLKLQRDLEAAEQSERRRIAANLHDGVCQKLTAAKYCMGAISKSLKLDGQMADLFKDSACLIEESLTELREVSHRLTPPEIEQRGLLISLRQMFDRLNDLDFIQIKFSERTGLPFLSLQQETVLYRSIQEAMNNVIKHSNASKVWVGYSFQENQLIFNIRDNGDGFNHEKIESKGGIGLNNLMERCQSIGAELSIYSVPKKGTTVKITLNLLAHEPN